MTINETLCNEHPTLPSDSGDDPDPYVLYENGYAFNLLLHRT